MNPAASTFKEVNSGTSRCAEQEQHCNRLLWKLKPYSWVRYTAKQKQASEKTLRLILAALVSLSSFFPQAFAQTFTNDSILTSSPYQVAAPATTPEEVSFSTEPDASVKAEEKSSLGPLSKPAEDADSNPSITSVPAFYVSTRGSDSGDGSEANPWRTIRYGVSRLRAGDTLLIMEGTYSENVNLAVSGREDAYITIKGVGNVVIDGTTLPAYDPVFETHGNDFLRFENLTVNNARAGVEVSPGSQNIVVDGLRTNRNHFAVKINNGQNITVRNAVATNSRNSFRAEGANTRNLLFENIETYSSKDIYDGYLDGNYYLNGDGFIFELGVANVTLRNIISANHWDAGFDIKANDVLIENVAAYGNKNNFKTWGQNITIKSSLSYGAKRQSTGTAWDGNGINVRQGTTRLINMTFADNEAHDVKFTNIANVRLQNSVIARRVSGNGTLLANEGGVFTEENNIWFNTTTGTPGFGLSATSRWVNPQFSDWTQSNFHLTAASSAINFGNSSFPVSRFDVEGNNRVQGANVDAGAYEFTGTIIPPPPPPVGDCSTDFCGVRQGQSVSGRISIGPNLTTHPDTRKVIYYLNGTRSGGVYQAPFLWGGTRGDGTQGFDTTTLTNGSYRLDLVYTDRTGDHVVQINFIVNNTTTPPPPPPTGGDFLGLTNGATVSGVIHVRPNPERLPTIQRAFYYINGTRSSQSYSAPYAWGGSEGFNTRTLANGQHTLSVVYRDATGDHEIQIRFTVNN